MSDYETWVSQMLNNVASDEKSEKIYKQCVIDEAIARINKENVDNTLISVC